MLAQCPRGYFGDWHNRRLAFRRQDGPVGRELEWRLCAGEPRGYRGHNHGRWAEIVNYHAMAVIETVRNVVYRLCGRGETVYIQVGVLVAILIIGGHPMAILDGI